MNSKDFDTFIWNSGGDLYYSSLYSEDNPFIVDSYYHSQFLTLITAGVMKG